MAHVGGSPAAMKLKKWDNRTHDFIKDISRCENNFQEGYRRKPIDNSVKHFWDPLSARTLRKQEGQRGKPVDMRMPHLNTARTSRDDKRAGKRVVKLSACETKKWRPNGNDCWFAKVGTPAPSIYTGRSSRSNTARSQRSARTGRSSARSTSRSARGGPATGSARSRTSEPGDDLSWEMSASELWDRKIQLERQLEAVREEQDALMCEQLSRVNEMSHK